jgi:hypothetical protein
MRVYSLPLLAKVETSIRKYMVPEVRSVQNLFNRSPEFGESDRLLTFREGSEEDHIDGQMEYLRQVSCNKTEETRRPSINSFYY